MATYLENYYLINRFTVQGVMLVNQRIQQFKFTTNQQILQTTCTTNFSDIDMQEKKERISTWTINHKMKHTHAHESLHPFEEGFHKTMKLLHLNKKLSGVNVCMIIISFWKTYQNNSLWLFLSSVRVENNITI